MHKVYLTFIGRSGSNSSAFYGNICEPKLHTLNYVTKQRIALKIILLKNRQNRTHD